MKDSMKKWFEDKDFDMADLPQGHEDRFLARLEAACEDESEEEKPKGKLILFTAVKKWSIAAAIAVIIGLGSFMAGRGQTFEQPVVTQELAEKQDFYDAAIKTQLAALDRKQSPVTEHLIADVKRNLKELEQDFEKIKKDFKINPDNPAVIDAMIDNYRNRIRLLEEARNQIELQQEQLKEQSNEII